MRVKLSLRKVLFIIVFLLGVIVFQNNVKATTILARATFVALALYLQQLLKHHRSLNLISS